MKKKIKDLTFFDLTEICLKAKLCDTCPLHIPDKHSGRLCLIGQLDHSLYERWPEIIEQEVDI